MGSCEVSVRIASCGEEVGAGFSVSFAEKNTEGDCAGFGFWVTLGGPPVLK